MSATAVTRSVDVKPATGAMTSLVLQRKCDCGTGASSLTGECEHCNKKKFKLQRKSSPLPIFDSQHSKVPPIVYEVLRSTGQPLDANTLAFMEPRFGHDFSRVRVHTDEQAATSARSIDARAYTVGQHIVFATGDYAPNHDSGRRLLAHELWHTVQQVTPGLSSFGSLEIGPSNHPSEREADEMATRVLETTAARPIALLPRMSQSYRAMLNRQPGNSFAACEAMGIFCPPIRGFSGRACLFSGCYRAATADLPFAISPGACFYRCPDGATCACVLIGRGEAVDCVLNICSSGDVNSQSDYDKLGEKALAMAADQSKGERQGVGSEGGAV